MSQGECSYLFQYNEKKKKKNLKKQTNFSSNLVPVGLDLVRFGLLFKYFDFL